MEKIRIYNLIILDASGSMESICNQALSGLNETIQSIKIAQKDFENVEQLLTFVSFSSGENYLHRVYDRLPINMARTLTKEDYKPYGGTALFDAMGTMITELQQVVRHDDRVLVTVITDGEENSSHRWEGRQIKSLVHELREMGWTFAYIGANQDVDKVADEIGIRNSLSFGADEEGTVKMFKELSRSRSSYYDKLVTGGILLEEDTSFFIKDEDIHERPSDSNSASVEESKKKGLLKRLFGK